jgi:cation diffusion facilitator CzcD-associated flavoprotein CzcO
VNRTSNLVHAAIVGAGPYGLSLAAHLREAGVPFRIFGHPMQSWATQMPADMLLKSDGFASNLSSGSVPFTLEDFCKLTGRTYHATQVPVKVQDFIAYGQEFARRFVPNLEEQNIASVEREDGMFRLTLASGDSFFARHVIVATGVSLFQYMPPDLAHLPKEMVTHTSAHRLFEDFAGQDVTVLGRGASSLNAAAALHEAGARVTLLTRKFKVHFHSTGDPSQRSWLERVMHPSSPLGYSLRSWISSTMPGLMRAMPGPIRDLMIYKHLGPAGGATLRERVEGKFPALLGWTISSAELIEAPNPGDRRIKLTLTNAEGDTREHITSHIIAGTGFRVDMKRYRFLNDSVREAIKCRRDGAPLLGRNFETSVKGLTMIGPVAHSSFGPLLRFAAGSQYAAERVTTQLVRSLAKYQPSERAAFAPLPIRSSVK